jgi:hypothetical protein
MRQTTVYTLEVTLTGGYMTDGFVRANPIVSRTIEIRADQTLNQLHRTIFEALDRWDDCHLSQFNLGAGVMDRNAESYVLPFIFDDPERYDEASATGSMTQTRLGGLGLQVGQVFWYWYDYGDDWQHQITVLAIGKAELEAKYPRVTARVGESPPQYVDWEGDDQEEVGEVAPAAEPRRVLGWIPVTSDVEAGVTEFADGSVLEWRHEVLSPEEISWRVGRGTGQTYRVTTFRELPDGTLVGSTYVVPGVWLNACVRELGRSDSETVLSVEVV